MNLNSKVQPVVATIVIVLAVLVLEKGWGVNYELEKNVLYEQIELIKPDNHHLLLEDLRQRTGINVKRFEVENIDFMRDTARLIIYYDDPQHVQDGAHAAGNPRSGD